MNFVNEYFSFKEKWYYKISSLLLDFYISKEINNNVERIKYDYLENIIESYIYTDIDNDKDIENKIRNIDFQLLNKLEYELLKHVICVSDNYSDIVFNESDYIYYAVLLEITILIYNTTFMGLNKSVIDNILKENLFRFKFIDFKIKQSKYNILLKYLKYINKYNDYYFSNLKNKNLDISITSLSKHHGYYIVDINNKLNSLLKYDEELVESVIKNNNYNNKLFILNFNILIQQLVLLLEKDRASIKKVIFNLDKYKYTRKSVNYINYFDNYISKYIMFSSSDKKKLDIISNRYDKCIYFNEDHKMSDYKDINILIKNSYWNNHKRDSKRLENLNFITINDNIAYKFDKEEK